MMFIQMFQMMTMFRLTWHNWRWLWRVCMLCFTRQNQNTIQERLIILMSFFPTLSRYRYTQLFQS